MMRALVYRPNNTAIHRLSPVVKLTWSGSLVVLSLIYSDPIYITLFFAAILLLVKLAGVWRDWVPVLKTGLWLGAGIIIINTLVSFHGSHVLLAAPFRLPVLGTPEITLEAMAFGAMMALKLLLIVSAFALVNLTVHPDDIMSVMIKMRLPYKSVLVTSLSTRFAPCLVEDARRISDAYRTRGMELDTGGLGSRLKKRAGTLIPLLSNSLDRAAQVAEAMEARAFGTDRKRTFFRDIKISRLDAVTILVAIMPMMAGAVLRIMKYGTYQFYPAFEKIDYTILEWALLAILAVLLLAIIPMAFLKREMELD